MTDEKNTKTPQETETKTERPKHRGRRSNKNTAKPAEDAVAKELAPKRQTRSRKKTLDEAIAAVIGVTAVAEEPAEPEKKEKPGSAVRPNLPSSSLPRSLPLPAPSSPRAKPAKTPAGKRAKTPTPTPRCASSPWAACTRLARI